MGAQYGSHWPATVLVGLCATSVMKCFRYPNPIRTAAGLPALKSHGPVGTWIPACRRRAGDVREDNANNVDAAGAAIESRVPVRLCTTWQQPCQAVRQPQGQCQGNQHHRREVERAKGIEPSALAWEARVLPLYDAREGRYSTPLVPLSTTAKADSGQSACL